jgi:hypothetical protein
VDAVSHHVNGNLVFDAARHDDIYTQWSASVDSEE